MHPHIAHCLRRAFAESSARCRVPFVLKSMRWLLRK